MTAEDMELRRLSIMERQVAIQEKQSATLDEQVKQQRKENPNYVASSIFLKPDGEPYADDLKCEMYFGPIRLNRTPLTKEEVEMLNRIQPMEKAILTKTDGSKTRIDIVPTENMVSGKLEKLVIQADMRKDQQPQHFGSMLAIATELANQHVAVSA